MCLPYSRIVSRHRRSRPCWRVRAAHLAKGPTAAYARAKMALRATFDNDLTTQLELEAHLQGECGKTRDFKEGVLAFLEKRAPRYEGR